MTGTSIAALFATMLVISVAPGPSDFAVVARSVAAGFAQALFMIAGIVVADFLFIVLAVYSLSEVAEWMGGMFVWVKYVCGAYLIWLGIGSMRAAPQGAAPAAGSAYASARSSFLGGLLITLGDPKAILFYMGLFPAFVDLADLALSDTVVIMIIATAVICGVKGTYAWLADRAKRLFEQDGVRRKLDIAAGCVLAGTGVFLLLAA
ncbi:MAG: LysE family translocator [Gammaproteobacteria bacterium]|nr:LysE family translocator [Gammaproteobacteria bacterium]